jgi:hypothetical protein
MSKRCCNLISFVVAVCVSLVQYFVYNVDDTLFKHGINKIFLDSNLLEKANIFDKQP